MEGFTLNNIGQVYWSQGDYAQALNYYQRALKIHREAGNRVGEGAALWNIGATYTDQKLYDQALPNLQQAFVIFRDIGIPTTQEETAKDIHEVLDAIRQQGNPAEYQRQCQATATATGLAVTEWCEGL
jgi:tetratricopeptide (TPR) repeat protein